MGDDGNARRRNLADELERELFDRFGPLVGGSDLVKALGYRTDAAFRQAVSRKTLPVAVFAIPGRKGKWCLVKDLVDWIVAVRGGANRNGTP